MRAAAGLGVGLPVQKVQLQPRAGGSCHLWALLGNNWGKGSCLLSQSSAVSALSG